MVGCGTRGDISGSGTGDGALAGAVPAPWNLGLGAPAAESFNDGPSAVASSGTRVATAGNADSPATIADLQSATLLTEGAVGDGSWHQDTRDMRAYHQRGLNVVFADGSVRSFLDINSDGYINPGFGVDVGTATPELTGYLGNEVEVSSFDWYTGVFLNNPALSKRFEN